MERGAGEGDVAAEVSELTALGPLDGRYAARMARLRDAFSEFALIRNRVRVELAWFEALCDEPALPEARPLADAERALLRSMADAFTPREAEAVKAFERRTNHDVKAVEYYLRDRLRGTNLEPLSEFLHFACTSEDISNLAHALMLRDGLAVLAEAQGAVEAGILALAKEWRAVPMLARTHGQAATPTTVGKELGVFAARLRRQRRGLDGCELLGKLNGAVGNYNAHVLACPEVDWPALARRVIEGVFGLKQNRWTTQIEPHDYMAEIFDAMARWNRVLLDFDRDAWAYISLGYFGQKTAAGEVGSSTMPHKVNPIDFENSEGNLGLANALLHHLSEKLPVSRLQRDLSDSTVLRNMGVAFGHCLLACESTRKGLSKLTLNRERIRDDLAEAWEVLAEPIQTAMRRAGLKNPYETLKALTRGRAVTREDIRALVAGLDLPPPARERLLALTPESYVGLAADLVDAL